ncbi:toxin (plasmid) [Plesiomonas shigelloides]|uniref:TA system toxin CbtA family protein n=1 Tax=Plesiomonas shigelloides TaxID=703 RepID=UPI000D12AE55|nr:TA system toxin CbtA family protein [Plesiomonas shigelloides]AVQ88871.1 toxin [Plesiomonas shigelloides]
MPKQSLTQARLLPITEWQIVLTQLLKTHYGLALDDTPFSDEQTIRTSIYAGLTLSEALNSLVDKYNLQRIDQVAFYCEPTPYISAYDIQRARRSTGLAPSH